MVKSAVECVKSAIELLNESRPEPPIMMTCALYDASVKLNDGKPFYTIDHRNIIVM